MTHSTFLKFSVALLILVAAFSAVYASPLRSIDVAVRDDKNNNTITAGHMNGDDKNKTDDNGDKDDKNGHKGHKHDKDDHKHGKDDDKNGKDDDKNGKDDDKKGKDDDKDDDDDDKSGSSGGPGPGVTGLPTAAQGNPVCFPASALVTLASGAKKRMVDLSIGDRVAVGGGRTSSVFMFTHKMADTRHQFVQLTTASGAQVRLTEGHYLPLDGLYKPARDAQIGNRVDLADGSQSPIVAIDVVSDLGLYNPQTTHGDIVVDGVRTSTYTTAVECAAAHALLAPLRAAFTRLGLVTRALEGGADSLSALLPSGH